MVLTGGVEERADQKLPIHYIFTLKMATAAFAETVNNFQHSMQLIPEARVVH
jgi:hypothetical protein